MTVRFKAHGVEYTSWTQASLRIQEHGLQLGDSP